MKTLLAMLSPLALVATSLYASEAKLKSAAIDAFENSEAVTDWEDYLADDLPGKTNGSAAPKAKVIETDCSNSGRCYVLITVSQNELLKNGDTYGVIVGKYLAETKGERIQSIEEISVLGSFKNEPTPAPASSIVLSAAKAAFSGSEEVTAEEDYLADDPADGVKSISTPKLEIIERDCTNSGTCAFIVSAYELLLDKNGSELFIIVGKYLVETQDDSVESVSELSVISSRK
ncbi:MAG: hypothetical protein AB7T49_13730 [Oligoflexales bacterium]